MVNNPIKPVGVGAASQPIDSNGRTTSGLLTRTAMTVSVPLCVPDEKAGGVSGTGESHARIVALPKCRMIMAQIVIQPAATCACQSRGLSLFSLDHAVNWEAISAIGQIVGAFAVVISLIYVASGNPQKCSRRASSLRWTRCSFGGLENS